jgi:hypothetical protein
MHKKFRVNNSKDYRKKSNPIGFDFMYCKEIYFYSKRTHLPYVYFFFNSKEEKKNFKWKYCGKNPVFLNNVYGYTYLEYHEEKISSFLRLLCKQKLKYNSWFTVTGVKKN